MNLISWILRPFRILFRLLKTAVGLAVIVGCFVSVTTAILIAVSSAAFMLVSSLVEGVLDLDTNRSRAQADLDRMGASHADEVASLTNEVEARDRRIASQADDIAAKERRIASQADQLVDLRASHADDVASMADEISLREGTIASQADELADLRTGQTVMYRGQPRLLREAVAETAESVSSRVVTSTTRNVASVFGEGLPLIGIAVAVTATGWEVKDACGVMEDMYELDIAMNPDHAVVGRPELCGMKVPTIGEVWAAILASPGATWDKMAQEYDDLPTKEMIWENIKASPGQLWGVLSALLADVAGWDWSALLDWPEDLIGGVGGLIPDWGSATVEDVQE
jgi:hypothetical protein